MWAEDSKIGDVYETEGGRGYEPINNKSIQ